ncbi:NDP-hexose 2,3-dehydratase family protein [Candidatus Uhrbacteria bacterium]|nr:NDP-hexose 2,3-dehydratase family protein [Candidatus Uhrbacteria bacterium]
MPTKVFWHSEEFRRWAKERAVELTMKVDLVSLSSLAPTWMTDNESISRPDGQFFKVVGVNISRSGGREISGWGQPMISQPSGFVALIRWFGNADIRTNEVLVRLFPEPGNKGIEIDGVNTRVLVGPPIQFSPGNLENHQKALRGECDKNGNPYRSVPFASVALETKPEWAVYVDWENAVEDGGRFFEKLNRYGTILVRSRDVVESEILSTGQPENFAWISLSALRDLRRLGYLNGHMHSLMSLLI